MWPLECTQKRLFLSKSKRHTWDLNNVHLSMYFSWSLSRRYLKFNTSRCFVLSFEILPMNVVYISILTSESHWKIRAIIVYAFVLAFTGRCCDSLLRYARLLQPQPKWMLLSVTFLQFDGSVKGVNIVWIIVLKVFWNISHVISISLFPCPLSIHRKIDERFMNKPLSEWRKLRNSLLVTASVVI